MVEKRNLLPGNKEKANLYEEILRSKGVKIVHRTGERRKLPQENTP
ncbi:MAG: hypothetical protein ACFFBD_29085 [Candidatus Hodarchaeota archaeon]